jgi:anhydro-N-acetylmuramic acid kinase
MAATLRMAPPATGDSRRFAIGVLVSADCTRLATTILACAGRGLEMVPEIVDGMIAEVPGETAGLFRQLAESGLAATDAAQMLATVRARLAELEAAVVNDLLEQAGIAPGQVLVIGVEDPGLWSSVKRAEGHSAGYLGLCDAARLAELTGLSVVDAFPARDVAAGGQGGPLAPMAQWLLLKDPLANRLLLDLGRTTRVSCLPRTASVTAGSEPRVLSFDVGPGTKLLDLLVHRLTDGEESFDPGGRNAVQGHQVQELLDHWLADPYLRRPLPRWHPRGVRPERFLFDAVQMAVDKGWSIRDLLCTATHFLAESVGLAVHVRVPGELAADQIILTGGGRQNGMLLRELAAILPGVPLVPIEDAGIEADALGPACYGLMALLYLDQTPANRPEVTGAEMCRVLGRLTPGSPQNWQRLIASMADARPALRSLRSAL